VPAPDSRAGTDRASAATRPLRHKVSAKLPHSPFAATRCPQVPPGEPCGKSLQRRRDCPTVFAMRIFPRQRARAVTGMLAVATCALLLTGCAQPDPVVTPRATSTVKPLFASDADALAAATKAYAAYLKMSDLITSQGGADPSRIDAVAAGEASRDAKLGFEKFQQKKYHSQGESAFDTSSIQQVDDFGDGVARISSYVCLDVSDVKVLDSDGVNHTPSARENRLPLQITVEADSGPQSLKLIRSESWSGKSFC